MLNYKFWFQIFL